MSNTPPKSGEEEVELLFSIHRIRAGIITDRHLTAKTALRQQPEAFYTLLEEMVELAESDVLRRRVEALKKSATQLELF